RPCTVRYCAPSSAPLCGWRKPSSGKRVRKGCGFSPTCGVGVCLTFRVVVAVTDSPADENRGTTLHDHAVLGFLACLRIPLDRFQLNELRRVELHLLAVSVVSICAALLGLKPRILGELALSLRLSAF